MTTWTARFHALVLVLSAFLVTPRGAPAQSAAGATAPGSLALEASLVDHLPTATPIKHVVVIVDEGVTFDHYFATYPEAVNAAGEPAFLAAPGTPAVDGLGSAKLLVNNPNFTNTANGTGAAEPFRLDRAAAATAAQHDGATAVAQAYDGGKADLFPLYTGAGTPGAAGPAAGNAEAMGYFDGNTVTALWQYAQNFSLADEFYADAYGGETAGALALVAGATLPGDADPAHDICSNASAAAAMTGKNIGDLMNAAHIPWGGFTAGFDLTATNANGTTGCARSTPSQTVGETVADYVPHHDGFQYFASTANPSHARPAALGDIGYGFAANGIADPANHEYDLSDFMNAVNAGDYPAVSYIRLPAFEDGHAGYSDPLDEQTGLVELVNFIESQTDWANTAIFVTYASGGGWYDHGVAAAGVRVPLLVISPWAKVNGVDHDLLSQASVVRFIEDNWLKGARLGGGSADAGAGTIMGMFDFAGAGNAPSVTLDPGTGEPSSD